MTAQIDRRRFLYSTLATGAGLALSPAARAQAGSDEPEPINIALLGAGTQGEVLLTTCVKMGDDSGIQFKAVCDLWEDLNLSRTVRLLARYGCEANAYTDYREMLAQAKDLDAVLIATPDFCHAEQTIACLKAGLHVYCEAPMAPTIDGARKMVKAAAQTDKLLQIGQQRRSNPRYMHCQAKLLETVGILGKLTAVNAQWHLPARPDRGWSRRRALDAATLEAHGYASMHQFKNWMWYRKTGAGPLVDYGVHQLDVINWLLGAAPKTVTARGGTHYYDAETHEWHDTVMAVLEYETKAGTVCASYEVLCTNGYGGHVEAILGDQGTLELSESSARGGVYRDPEAPDWNKWVRLGLLSRPEDQPKPPGSPTSIDVAETTPPAKYEIPVTVEVPYHQPHLANFFAAIRGQAELNCPAAVAYPATVTALKINEAIAKGQTLTLGPDTFAI